MLRLITPPEAIPIAAALDAETCFDVEASEWDATGYRLHFENGGVCATWHRDASGTGTGDAIGIASWYISAHPHQGHRSLYLVRFGIVPAQRRRGHGRSCFDALCQHGVAQGCSRVWMHVRTENLTAIRFWTAVGCRSRHIETVGGHAYHVFEKE